MLGVGVLGGCQGKTKIKDSTIETAPAGTPATTSGIVVTNPGDKVVVSRPAPDVVVVQQPSQPPPAPPEMMTASPGSEYVWVPGAHEWRDGRWEWVSGHWMRPVQAGETWEPGHWRQVPGGWTWEPGHWR